MAMATVTINDKVITVPDGTLILDAARQAGFDIPTFCYQADLIGIGSCRMCLVEIEGQAKLHPSCIVPVMDGMTILTESPVVKEARAAMLEFLLANHGLDCPVCDKGGECELQDMVYNHGPHIGRHQEEKLQFHTKDYIISPVIIKNSNRCVQCMKCVRVCKEIVGMDVLDAIGRGEHQEETSFFKGMLECDQDGNCIEVCPVGCFMRVPFRYKTRPWDLDGADTICPYCGTGCRMKIEARDGDLIRSRAQLGVGINSETLCARGRFGYDFVDTPERLTQPLLKKEGVLTPVSWEEARSAVVQAFTSAQGNRLGGVASAHLTNEELFLFQQLMRETLGCPNIDSDWRWSTDDALEFVVAARMDHGGVSLFKGMEADCAWVIGTQLSEENPVSDYMVRRMSRENYTPVIISSPRGMKLDAIANLVLRYPPGAEFELLSAVADGVIDPAGATLSGERSPDVVLKKAPGSASPPGKTGVEALSPLVKQLSAATRISLLVGTDFLRFPKGSSRLAGMVSKLETAGKEITIIPILDRCNQRGAWEMGIHPLLHPGYQQSTAPGMGAHDILAAAEAGNMGALYLIGSDPMAYASDPDKCRQSLAKVGFLVVQEPFLTETARLADCVLPAATFAEKKGTFTNQEGRVQSIEALMKLPGEAKTDLAIMAELGRQLGMEIPGPMGLEAALFTQIRHAIPMYANVDLQFENRVNTRNDLDNVGALVQDSGNRLQGTQDLSETSKIQTTDGTFTLVTGNHLFFSGRLAHRSAILNTLLPEPTVEISSEDAKQLNLSPGDRVVVKGSRHEVRLRLAIGKASYPKVAFISENFPDVPVHRFFAPGASMAPVEIIRADGEH